MNKLRYTFIFLILISLFPCHGLLADEKTDNVTQQEITESIEKKNVTENVTETISTSTTENESEENHVNIKPQKKENIFIQIMKWLGFIILIAVIACVIGRFFENLFEKLFKKKYKNYKYYNTAELGLGIGIIYFILAIVLKAYFKISFFWSTIIPFSIFPVVCLIVFIIYKRYKMRLFEIKNNKIEELSRKLLHANSARIVERDELIMFINDFDHYDDFKFCEKNYIAIRNRIEELRNEITERERLEAEEQRQQAEKEKQEALEQIQNEAAMERKANENEMKKSEVERNINELGGYIDKLGVYIQKKELPDVQMVSELYKILISILDSKPYITKEGLCKICDDNDVFIKHVLEKCSELENFSGSLLETRMQQVKAKFDNILG